MPDLASAAACLASPVRVQVLALLGERAEVSVMELANEVGLAQSTVSYHVSRLLEAGLVRVRRDGRWHFVSRLYDGLNLKFDHAQG